MCLTAGFRCAAVVYVQAMARSTVTIVALPSRASDLPPTKLTTDAVNALAAERPTITIYEAAPLAR